MKERIRWVFFVLITTETQSNFFVFSYVAFVLTASRACDRIHMEQQSPDCSELMATVWGEANTLPGNDTLPYWKWNKNMHDVFMFIAFLLKEFVFIRSVPGSQGFSMPHVHVTDAWMWPLFEILVCVWLWVMWEAEWAWLPRSLQVTCFKRGNNPTSSSLRSLGRKSSRQQSDLPSIFPQTPLTPQPPLPLKALSISSSPPPPPPFCVFSQC